MRLIYLKPRLKDMSQSPRFSFYKTMMKDF